MQLNKIELLTPAGSWDAFLAAVENGADAVYLGGKLFNARQFASNFDGLELPKVMEYAHQRNVKVYLTLNTLLTKEEISQALALAKEAYCLGVSAIIVQDLGLGQILKKVFPDLPLHASTQMTIYDKAGVHALAKLGFQRVVLARELTLSEVEEIAKDSPIELEVFVHGALCVCYSGLCLMSSIIGERSGNRGKCAQPCRWNWQLYSKNQEESYQLAQGYLLSPKDMLAMQHIPELVNLGVRCIKIEGRMKSPEYVATVVRAYRDFLDNGNISQNMQKDLQQIFNRGGFTSGYLGGKPRNHLLSIEKPKNWGIQLGKIVASDSRKRLVLVQLQESISLGDGIEIWNGEEESPGIIISQILEKGTQIKSASSGSTVWLGDISGHFQKGNLVFRTSSKELNERARQTFQGKFIRKIALTGNFSYDPQKGISFIINDNEGNKVEISETFWQSSTKSDDTEEDIQQLPELSKERILEQIQKTGNTPFVFSNIEVSISKSCRIAISILNKIRREGLSKITELRHQNKLRKLSQEISIPQETEISQPNESQKILEQVSKAPNLSLFFYHWNTSWDLTKLENSRIIIPFSQLWPNIKSINFMELAEKNIQILAWILPITKGNYHKLVMQHLPMLIDNGLKAVLAGNLGTIEELRQNFPSLHIFVDHTLNIFNPYSLAVLTSSHLKYNLSGITLSPEMNLEQLQNANLEKFSLELEVLAYGRLMLMITENCIGAMVTASQQNLQKQKNLKNTDDVLSPANTHSLCASCPCQKEVATSFYLKDRIGIEFPIICDQQADRSIILNSKILFVPQLLSKLLKNGITSFRLAFTEENYEQILKVVQIYRETFNTNKYQTFPFGKPEQFTQGHYFRKL